MKTQTREAQAQLSARQALELLKKGNDRFQANLRANRNLLEQVNARTPAELVEAMIADGQIGIVGGMYSVQTGEVRFAELACGSEG